MNGVDIKIYNESKPYKIYFEREILIDGKLVKKKIPFEEESKGTKKIFMIMIKIMICMSENKIFYCDDMNLFSHPKLCAPIIRQFTDESNNSSQLILNSN